MKDKFDKPMVSVTKTKSLLKKFLGLSYKADDEVNSSKLTPDSLK